MERFDDLMGITHDTGDAFLDKKLNQNTCNIIGTIAAGAVLGALNKPKGPKVAGGGIDPFLKPYAEPILKDIREMYAQGPQAYQGERIAGFTDPELAAQTSLLALSGVQPDYYGTALGGLEEAIALQRGTAAPITAEAIQERREMLAPVAERERLEAQQAFERSLRDIGTAGAGAGTGGYLGTRADILRGGAAGELALAEAGIQAGLTERAIGMTEADLQRQAAAASGLAALTGQQLGVGQERFGEEVERIGLGADVGRQQRILEQDIIGAEMAKFKEEDPFTFAQQALQTVMSTPTQPTQIYQPQSTMQSVLGGISAMSGFANQGGGISSLAAGGTFSKEEKDEIKDIEDFSDKEYGTKYGEERKEADKADKDKKLKKGLRSLAKAAPSDSGNTLMGQQQGRSQQVSLQQQAAQGVRRRLGMYQEGGAIEQEETGILGRILGGVTKGVKALRDIKFDEATESLGKYDPFTGLSRTERLRVGLAMMGQMPQLGQGPLSAAAAGATPILSEIAGEQLTEAEIARKRAADLAIDPFEEKPTVYNQILKHAATKFDFVFDMDSNEFKQASGDALTKSQADELAEAAAAGYEQYAKTGKLLPALQYINVNY